MKNLLFNLSSVSEFFKEKRFIYEETPKAQPEVKAENKDLPKMAKDVNEAVRAAQEAARESAKKSGILGSPEFAKVMERMAGKSANLEPKLVDKNAQVAGKLGKNVAAEDVKAAAHDNFPTATAMPTIEKKKWR